MPDDVLNKRTFASKTFDNGDGSFTLEAHAGHVHYKDDGGDLQDVDLTFEDAGTYWQVTKASYRLYVAKDFGAADLIRFDNKFEGADHSIYYEPHSLWWINMDQPSERQQFRSAQSVTGQLIDDHTIRWLNAFGAGIHFQVQLQRFGFRKEIIATAAPQNPPFANYAIGFVSRWRGTGLTVKADDGQDWDGSAYYESEGGFQIREAGGARSYIQRAYGEDSDGNLRLLKVFFEQRAGSLWQGKLLPKSLLEAATYPIAADTTTTYYAGGGEGLVGRASQATWALAHDTADGTIAHIASDGTKRVQGDVSQWGGNFWCFRGFVPIDTSGLPDGASISAASFVGRVAAVGDDDNDALGYATIVQTNQVSPTALEVGDFDECGESAGSGWSSASETDIIEGIDAGDRADLTGISVDDDITFPLNATGISWISKTSYTKLGMRLGHDMQDTACDAGNGNWLHFDDSDDAGGSDPYLSVTYSIGSVPVMMRYYRNLRES